MALFILIKRGKKVLGVIPAKKGALVSQLKRLIRQQISKGFAAKIINSKQLKVILKQMLPSKAKRILKKTKSRSRRIRKIQKIRIQRQQRRINGIKPRSPKVRRRNTQRRL